MAEIIAAKRAGFCYGVRRAVDALTRTAGEKKAGRKIYLLGNTIHNKTFMDEVLTDPDIKLIDDSEIDLLASLSDRELNDRIDLLFEKTGILIVRAHGLQRNLLRALEEKRLEIIDSTCGDVKKIYDLIERETDAGSLTLIIGDKNHPEVKGIESCVPGEALIFPNHKAAARETQAIKKAAEKAGRVIAVSQTTHDKRDFLKIRELLEREIGGIKICDTICPVTALRQEEAREIAGMCGIVIVAGSAESSNTKKILEISKTRCKDTFLIESANELPGEFIKARLREDGNLKIGITAGASTPDRIIVHIIKEVEKLLWQRT